MIDMLLLRVVVVVVVVVMMIQNRTFINEIHIESIRK